MLAVNHSVSLKLESLAAQTDAKAVAAARAQEALYWTAKPSEKSYLTPPSNSPNFAEGGGQIACYPLMVDGALDYLDVPPF